MIHQRALLICIAALALHGCGKTDPMSRGVESVHQPVITRTNYVQDVRMTGRGRLDREEEQRLNGWFESLGLRYGDVVAIDSGAAEVPEAFSAHVNDLLRRHALQLEDAAPVTPGEIAPGTVRVVVSRTSASVPNCPDWRPQNHDFNARQSSNFGCAINSSLAAMVANPEDLVGGRAPDGSSIVTATRAIKRAGTAASSSSGSTTSSTGNQ